MTLDDISILRLVSQQIAATKLKTAKDIVGFMGAMQAQDYAMAKWAIGARLLDSTDKQIEAAINKGEVLRTHLMRPTWHFVSADDIYWMLELTAPRLKTVLKGRQQQLGLTESVIKKSNSIIQKVVSEGNHLTREELMTELKKSKINVDNDNRSAHLMFCAELDGIVCSGSVKGNKQTYALLEERVKTKKRLTREEALAELANRYFSSHCPATIEDFVWWSGLRVADAKLGLERVRSNFSSQTIGSETYWYSNTFSASKNTIPSVYLLPAFDEFTISYKNRKASLPEEHNGKAISSNGIFRPLIVVNGKVTGLWKRTVKKDKVVMELSHFKAPDKKIKVMVEEAAASFGLFLGKTPEVVHLK